MSTTIPTNPIPGQKVWELRKNSFHYTCKTCGQTIHPSLNVAHFEWTKSNHPYAGRIEPVTGKKEPTHFWNLTHWTHLNCK